MELVLDLNLWEEFLEAHGYDLLGLIDSGSFSDVFAVRKRSTDQVLAVKRMVARRDIGSDPRVMAEVSCLSQLGARGAHVIRLEHTILLDSLACLFLEMAPYGDLERHVQLNWPLSEKLVTCCVRQILSALVHCHRLDIAHRDINPANVLLVTPHSVRLADFGLAVRCRGEDGSLLTCDDYLGRESYLGPEVLQCTPYLPKEADLWSMGCLCYFILTGEHPLTARNRATSVGRECVDKYLTPRQLRDCDDDVRCQNRQQRHQQTTPFKYKHVTKCLSDSSIYPLVSVEVEARSCLREENNNMVSSCDNIFSSPCRENSSTSALLTRLVSLFCVHTPAKRLRAEDGLAMWKRKGLPR